MGWSVPFSSELTRSENQAVQVLAGHGAYLPDDLDADLDVVVTRREIALTIECFEEYDMRAVRDTDRHDYRLAEDYGSVPIGSSEFMDF